MPGGMLTDGGGNPPKICPPSKEEIDGWPGGWPGGPPPGAIGGMFIGGGTPIGGILCGRIPPGSCTGPLGAENWWNIYSKYLCISLITFHYFNSFYIS